MKTTTQKALESIASIRDDLDKIELHIGSSASLDVSEIVQKIDNLTHIAWIVCDEERMEIEASYSHEVRHGVGRV